MKLCLLVFISAGLMSACAHARHPRPKTEPADLSRYIGADNEELTLDKEPRAPSRAGKKSSRVAASVPSKSKTPLKKSKSLGISFRPQGHTFVVENLNGKAISQLNVGDEILLIDGKKPKSASQMKSLVSSAATKKKWVRLSIIRGGKKRTIFEPIAIRR
jgi:hypothetical protein